MLIMFTLLSRSIRSFNKVFIMFLPIILAPYFVEIGIQSCSVWQPYFIAVLFAFVFSTLQGAQVGDLIDNFISFSPKKLAHRLLHTPDTSLFGSTFFTDKVAKGRRETHN